MRAHERLDKKDVHATLRLPETGKTYTGNHFSIAVTIKRGEIVCQGECGARINTSTESADFQLWLQGASNNISSISFVPGEIATPAEKGLYAYLNNPRRRPDASQPAPDILSGSAQIIDHKHK
jgi:hypothetical protein